MNALFKEPPKGEELLWFRCLKKTEYWASSKASEGLVTTTKVDSYKMFYPGDIIWIRKREDERVKSSGNPKAILPFDNAYRTNYEKDCFLPLSEESAYRYLGKPKPLVVRNYSSPKGKVLWARARCEITAGGRVYYKEGEVTWFHSKSFLFACLPEGNYHGQNFAIKAPEMFTELTPGELHSLGLRNSSPPYRFKTEQEFKDSGDWNAKARAPQGWGTNFEFNYPGILGKEVPTKYQEAIEKAVTGRQSYAKFDETLFGFANRINTFFFTNEPLRETTKSKPVIESLDSDKDLLDYMDRAMKANPFVDSEPKAPKGIPPNTLAVAQASGKVIYVDSDSSQLSEKEEPKFTREVIDVPLYTPTTPIKTISKVEPMKNIGKLNRKTKKKRN